MAEYIKREYAVDAVLDVYYDTPDIDLSGEKFETAIFKIPAADVVPVRHGHCPYCDAKTNDFISINQTVEYSGIEIALNRQGMLRVRVYESGQETFTAQDIVEIKYCPNCGCKMDGESDE